LVYPIDLFNHKIFVGNQHQALSKEIIDSLKITHIVNATNHLANKFEDIGIKYFNVPVEDNDKFIISPYFKSAYTFIEDALTEGKLENGDFNDKKDHSSESSIADLLDKSSNQFESAEIMQKYFNKHYYHTKNKNRILIHCSLGVSRSSTIAIMYIMKKFSISSKEACNFVKFQKEASCPINNFLYELEEFEAKLNNFE